MEKSFRETLFPFSFCFWSVSRHEVADLGTVQRERKGERDKMGADEWMDGWSESPGDEWFERTGKEETEGPIGGWHHRISLERTRNTYPSLVQNSFLQFVLILFVFP